MNTNDRCEMRCATDGCSERAIIIAIEVSSRRCLAEHHYCSTHGAQYLSDVTFARRPGPRLMRPPAGMAVVDIESVLIHMEKPEQLVVLREANGFRTLAFCCGIFEATAITRGLKREHSPRPLTHSAALAMVESLGAHLRNLIAYEAPDRFYGAMLHLERRGETFEVDVRLSDAIAMAVLCDAQILSIDSLLDRPFNLRADGIW